MRSETPAVAGLQHETIMVKARVNRKDYHTGGPDRHLATWTPTQFKYISQRANLFHVRRRAQGLTINRVFPSLREAKDFVASSGFDLIRHRSRREPMTDMVEKARHYLDWVAQTKYEPGDTAIAHSIRGGGNGFI